MTGWKKRPRAESTTRTSWSGQRASFPTAVKNAIRKRDRVCQGCGAEDSLEVDHIVGHAAARRAGWTLEQIDDPSNGQLLCPRCHEAKTRHEQTSARARATRDRPTPRHPGML